MWKQISLTEALQGFLAGRTIKIVDFDEEAVDDLQAAFQRLQESAVFFMEEDKVTIAVTGLPEGSTVQKVSEAISSAIKRFNEDLTATPEPEEPEEAGDHPPPAGSRNGGRAGHESNQTQGYKSGSLTCGLKRNEGIE